MTLASVAIGAAIGAVGGVVALKDKDMPVWKKALIGAGVGATGGVAAGLLQNVMGNVSSNVADKATQFLPTGTNPVSFTGNGMYAGKTEKQWLAAAAKHAGIEATTGVNQQGYINDCIRYAENAAKNK